MENNKSYLGQIHWALLFGFISSAWLSITFNYFQTSSSFLTNYSIELVYALGFYGALHLMLRPPVFITVLAASMRFGYSFLPEVSLGDGGSMMWLMYFLRMLPLILFIGLLTRWPKQMLPITLLLLVSDCIFHNSNQAAEGMVSFFSSREDVRFLNIGFQILFQTAAFILYVVVVCELVNFARNKHAIRSTTLLNLGNNFSKSSSIIIFWSFKTALWSILIAGFNLSFAYMSYDYFGGSYTFLKFRIILNCLGSVATAIFIGWYLRKFMIEHFILFGRGTKFLYWFCLLPVIGTFVFAGLLAETEPSRSHPEKVRKLEELNATVTTGVTAILFLFVGVRFFWIILGEAPAVVFIVLIASLILLIATIYSRSGYLVNCWLNGIVIAFLFLVMIFGAGPREYPSVISLIAFNLTNLLMLYPVYYLEDFVYTPAEDPDKTESSDLFG